DVGVGDGDHGGPGGLAAGGRSARDCVILDDQFAVQDSVRIYDSTLENELGGIRTSLNGGLRIRDWDDENCRGQEGESEDSAERLWFNPQELSHTFHCCTPFGPTFWPVRRRE